ELRLTRPLATVAAATTVAAAAGFVLHALGLLTVPGLLAFTALGLVAGGAAAYWLSRIAARLEGRAGERAREYVERLLSGMAKAMLLADPRGAGVRANPAAAELLGRPVQALGGTAAREVLIGDSPPAVDHTQAAPRRGAATR